MIKNLTLVVSLDNPETLNSILKLLEPFQEEISVSVRDNGDGPIMMAHVGPIGHVEALDRTLLQELRKGMIMVCGPSLHATRLQRQEQAEIFAGNLKELGRSLKIDTIEIIKDPEKHDSTNKKQLQRWGSRQTNNYQSKVPRKFMIRSKKR